jgi:hypothetical protein
MAGAFSTARAALAFLASAASWSLMRFSSATLASAFAFASDLAFASAASAFSFASAASALLLHQPHQPLLFPWHLQEIEPLPAFAASDLAVASARALALASASLAISLSKIN